MYVYSLVRIIFLFPCGKSMDFQNVGILCYKMHPWESTNIFQNQLALSKRICFFKFQTYKFNIPVSKKTFQNCSVPSRGNTIRIFVCKTKVDSSASLLSLYLFTIINSKKPLFYKTTHFPSKLLQGSYN